METWNPVPSVPGWSASSEGRVRLEPFLASMPRGGNRLYGGEPTVGCLGRTRSPVTIMHKGKTYRVARMVCEAFHGPPPDGLRSTLHQDENSKNNRPENLRWGTQKENLNAPGFLAYCRSRTGANNPLVKGRS